MRWHILLLSISLVGLPMTGCAQDSASQAYVELESAWAESRASNDGVTVASLQEWARKFWEFRQRYPNTDEASKAAVRALELTWDLRDIDGLAEKYGAISIDDDAMIDAVRYVPSVVGQQDAEDEWRRIAMESENPPVQAAALVELADLFYITKRYSHVANLVDTLETRYDVTVQHERYGTKIDQMRESVRTLSVGSILPEFHATTINGEIVSLSELRGKVVLLYFYGSGCGACIKMYPMLNELYAQHRDDDFLLLGISADRGFLTLAEFQSFLETYSIRWPQSLDRELFDQYKVGVLSTAFLVNKAGRLVWMSRADEMLETIDALKGKDLAGAVGTVLES